MLQCFFRPFQNLSKDSVTKAILIWLFRLAREQMGVSPFVAICFVAGRFAVELAIGLLAGVQTGIGLG